MKQDVPYGGEPWCAPLSVRILEWLHWYRLPWRWRLPLEDVVTDFLCWWKIQTTPPEIAPRWIQTCHDHRHGWASILSNCGDNLPAGYRRFEMPT